MGKLGAEFLIFVILLFAANLAEPSENANADDDDEISTEAIIMHNTRSIHEQAIVRQILKDYKVNIRPRGINPNNAQDGGPVLVYTTIILKSITSINDANMEFTVQFLFKQEWYDTRLKFELLDPANQLDYVTLASDQRVWIPDTFFQNEKRGHYHEVDKPNMFLRIRYDGRVIYSRRLSMTFACAMYLARYPHDTQFCEMAFATYAYTTNDIEYIWSRDAIVDEMTSRMRPKFSIDHFINGSCTSETNTGKYSCLQVELQLRRVFSFFLLQLYIPSIMLVAVSCVSYWIDWKASPARVPLSIVTLLTMITQSHSINSSLPPVSYTKAIDIWVGACIIFIFSSLIEYAFVNYTGVQEERRKAKIREANTRKFYAGHDFTGPGVDIICSIPTQLSRLQRDKLIQERNKPKPGIMAFLLSKLRKPTVVTEIGPAHRMAASESSYGFEEMPLQDRQSYQTPYSDNNPNISRTVETGFENGEFSVVRNRQQRMWLRQVYTFLKQKGTAERIDIVSRVFFPACFVCFNVAYWIAYW